MSAAWLSGGARLLAGIGVGGVLALMALAPAGAATGVSATPDSGSTTQGVAVSLPVLADDTPSEGSVIDPGSLRLIDPSTGGEVTSLSVPELGTWTVSPRGLIGFQPVRTYVGTTAPLGYTARDSSGATLHSWFDVTVTAVIPHVVPDIGDADPQGSVTVPVLANDRAGSDSAPLVPASVQLYDPRTGYRNWTTSITIPGLGSYHVDPASGAVAFVSSNSRDNDVQPGPFPVEYRVADTSGTYATGSVTVHAFGFARANPDAVTSTQGSPAILHPTANDQPCAASPAGSPLGPIQLVDWSTGDLAQTVVVPGEGTWSEEGDDVVSFHPLPGFTGTTAPTGYRLPCGPALGELEVTVEPVLPVARPVSATVRAGGAVLVAALGQDLPGTTGAALDPASLRLLSPSTGAAVLSYSTPGSGRWSVDGTTGQVRFDALSTATLVTPARYVVSDTNGSTAGTTISLAVRAAAVPAPTPSTGARSSGSETSSGGTTGVSDPVAAPAPTLPQTGADLWPLVDGGGLAVLGGVGLLVLGRRRGVPGR